MVFNPKDYWRTEKGKEVLRKYRQSLKGKQTIRRYQVSEKGKIAYRRAYLKYWTPEKRKIDNKKAYLKRKQKNPNYTKEVYQKFKRRLIEQGREEALQEIQQ